MPDNMKWQWRAEGFLSEPQRRGAPSGLKLYRAWGGTSLKNGSPSRPGVCLSTQRPSTRLEAERLFSAWEWGNPCLWLTDFRVVAGTPIYIGAVDPGDYVSPTLMGSSHGVQVFIENPVHSKQLIEVATTRLLDDLGGRYVVPGSRISQ
jgi:hypothetical protein